MDDDAAHHGEDGLDRRIAEAEAKQRRSDQNFADADRGGWGMGVEFTGSVLVASFIGYGIDRFAGTLPWFLIGFMVLGFCAGIYSLIKSSRDSGDGA